MVRAVTNPPQQQLRALKGRLVDWLRDAAYPRWSQQGIDEQNGGFIETLAQNGIGLPHPRRARVHPRQIYAFAQAPSFGWAGDARRIVLRGCDYFETHYRRADGLFRTLAGADGSPLDDRAVLYDQAFALLGFAAAAVVLDAREAYEKRALELRAAIDRTFGSDQGAFRSTETADPIFESNPHMHLLEACQAWAQLGRDAGWKSWVQRLVDLALQRFIRADTGALGEVFTRDWRPADGLAGRIIEPGHQFEWAWLLLRAEGRQPLAVRPAALRLIAVGEQSGVHNQVAVNSLLDDLSLHDGNARCWPQTERLKAALIAAKATQEDRYWEMAASAAASLLPYLATPLAGLWFDVQLPSGQLVDSPAPASTFYHLVGAISVLNATVSEDV